MSQPPKRPNSQPRPWEQGGDADAVSFGSWLRRQREMRDISLREIAEATKISFRYLEALEQDRFEVLPAPVFARGFLREYARCVGIDGDDVVNYYLSAQGQDLAPTDSPADAVPNLPRKRRDWLYAVTVGAGLLVLLGVVAAAGNSARASGRGAGSGGGRSDATGHPGSRRLRASGHLRRRHARRRDRFVRGNSASRVRISPVAPSASHRPSRRPPVSRPTGHRCGSTSSSPPTAGSRRVIDGGDRLAELRVAGEALTLEAQRSIVLTLGDARGVRLLVNGRPYPLRPDSHHIVRDLRIAVDDLAPPSAPQAPAGTATR